MTQPTAFIGSTELIESTQSPGRTSGYFLDEAG